MGTLRFSPAVLLFMLPAFALYGVFFIVPFARTVWYSFFEWNGMDQTPCSSVSTATPISSATP